MKHSEFFKFSFRFISSSSPLPPKKKLECDTFLWFRQNIDRTKQSKYVHSVNEIITKCIQFFERIELVTLCNIDHIQGGSSAPFYGKLLAKQV